MKSCGHCIFLFNSEKKRKGKRNYTVFRAAYGKLAILRSFLKEGEDNVYLFFYYSVYLNLIYLYKTFVSDY